MAFFKNDGLCVQEYVYDYAVDGGVKDVAIALHDKAGYAALPVGAIVLDVVAHVVTAITSSGSATVAWGDDDADGYSGTTIAKATLAQNYVMNAGMNAAALLWDNTNDVATPFYVDGSTRDGGFNVLISTENLNGGKIVFSVLYLKPNV